MELLSAIQAQSEGEKKQNAAAPSAAAIDGTRGSVIALADISALKTDGLEKADRVRLQMTLLKLAAAAMTKFVALNDEGK